MCKFERLPACSCAWLGQQNEGATEVVLFHRLLDGICETKFTEKQAAHAWTEGAPRLFAEVSMDSLLAMTGHPMLVISLNVDAASRYFLSCLASPTSSSTLAVTRGFVCNACRHLFNGEEYVPGADNTVRSQAFVESVQKFWQSQQRSW